MEDEANTAAPAAAPAASGGSKMVPLLLVMNTLLMGGVLMMVLRKPAATPAASAAPAAAGPEEKDKKGIDVPGPMMKLDSFVIQLKSTENERYVRVSFDLELGAEPDKDVITARMSQIRDAVISYFSDRSLDELRGSTGMEHIKETLLKRLDEVVPGHRVKAVYVTDFIVQ